MRNEYAIFEREMREQDNIEAGREYWDDGEKNTPVCRGCGKCDNSVHERFDAYGITTGFWCNKCYDSDEYPYRKDHYFDPGYAGERMDDDY